MIRYPVSGQEDLSLVLCGAAGQGVQTVETLLVRLFQREGFHVFASKEAMSRVRGGSNSTEIRLASRPVRGLLDRMDLLVCFNRGIRPNIRERSASSPACSSSVRFRPALPAFPPSSVVCPCGPWGWSASASTSCILW